MLTMGCTFVILLKAVLNWLSLFVCEGLIGGPLFVTFMNFMLVVPFLCGKEVSVSTPGEL